MPFLKKSNDVKKKSEEEEEEKEEKKEEKKEKKENKKTVWATKVKPQLNPYCTKCPHRPPQSLTPKGKMKYQKEKNYNQLYKLT